MASKRSCKNKRDSCPVPTSTWPVSAPVSEPAIGNEKCTQTFSARTFRTPPGVRDIPAKIPGYPRFFSSKPKEDKLSREGTKFSTPTPSHGRPPPHRAVSGPKKLIFVLFFLAWCKATCELPVGWPVSFFLLHPGTFLVHKNQRFFATHRGLEDTLTGSGAHSSLKVLHT